MLYEIPMSDQANTVLDNDDILIFSNLIRGTAIRFHQRLVPGTVLLDDLISECWIAAIQGRKRWNSSLGIPFTAYIQPRLIGSMKDFLRSMDIVPRDKRKILREAEKVRSTLELERGMHVSRSDVAAGMEIDQILLDNTISCAEHFSIRSLDEAIDGMSPLEAIIADPRLEDQTKAIEKEMVFTQLRECITHLPISERMVIEMRYFMGLKMREMATELSVSESRISQIHTQAIDSLRAIIGEFFLDLTDLAVA